MQDSSFCIGNALFSMKKLQISQNKTIRFIKNLGLKTHIGFSELDSLGMLNVDLRTVTVKQSRLSHVHKISNGGCPSYVSEHFVNVSNIHSHNTRGSGENFVVPLSATTFC